MIATVLKLVHNCKLYKKMKVEINHFLTPSERQEGVICSSANLFWGRLEGLFLPSNKCRDIPSVVVNHRKRTVVHDMNS